MAGIGCLAPIILAVLGALGGNAVGGSVGAAWGLGGGFVLGSLIAGFAWYAVKRYKDEEN